MCKLQTDRQVDSKTKEVLIKWVMEFLYQFDLDGYEPGGTGMPNEEAAKILVEEICSMQNRLLSGEPIEKISLINPELYFHSREG